MPEFILESVRCFLLDMKKMIMVIQEFIFINLLADV